MVKNTLFQKKKVLVVGDFMLDVYTLGRVERISPEAPVPILHVTEERRLPGGAGNTVLNLVSLGMEVIPFGRLGEDMGGAYFLQTFEEEGIEQQGIFKDPTYQTPIKNRLMASGQQLGRVDYEQTHPLSESLQKEMLRQLPTLLEGITIVAISDYAKGLLTPSFLRELIDHSRARGIPVIVDPKGRDFLRYRGATILKPNLSEALAGAGLPPEATFDEVGQKILKDTSIETLLITRSKEGISFFQRDIRKDFPAYVREIKDVTGAGDTVLAVITAALANSLSFDEAIPLSNIAAGLAIEQLGCARISQSALQTRFQEGIPSN